MTMKATVVIPTRDRPEMLALTLQTVLWQQRLELEVIVVDDGVGSDTRDVVQRVGDRRVHLLTNTGPPGVSGARNTGLGAASGDWIAFLDDDDLWAPGKLAAQIAAAEETGAIWVYGGHVNVDTSLCIRDGAPPPPPEEVVASLRRYNAVPAGASNVAVRRDVMDTVGGFDPALSTSEDWDLWLRLAAAGRPVCVPRPLVALRLHSGMASRAVERMLADVELVARRHGIPVDRARHHRWAAWMSLESGRRSVALRHYANAAAAGDLVSVARAAVALTYPRLARAGARVVADEWVREAEGWLQPLRADLNEPVVKARA